MRCLSLLAALAATLPAAEVRRADLELWAEALPTAFAYTITNKTTGDRKQGNDELQHDAGLRLGGRFTWAAPGRPWAPVWGIDVGLTDAATAGATSGSDLTIHSTSAGLAAGLAWCPRLNWLLQGEGFASYGLANASASLQSTHAAFAATGTTSTSGLRAIIAWTFARRWSAAATAGWMQSSSQLSGRDFDLDWNGSGATVGIGIIWRMDLRCAALE